MTEGEKIVTHLSSIEHLLRILIDKDDPQKEELRRGIWAQYIKGNLSFDELKSKLKEVEYAV